MVDLLFLEDGKIIGISADVAVLYPSIEDFEDQTGDGKITQADVIKARTEGYKK